VDAAITLSWLVDDRAERGVIVIISPDVREGFGMQVVDEESEDTPDRSFLSILSILHIGIQNDHHDQQKSKTTILRTNPLQGYIYVSSLETRPHLTLKHIIST